MEDDNELEETFSQYNTGEEKSVQEMLEEIEDDADEDELKPLEGYGTKTKEGLHQFQKKSNTKDINTLHYKYYGHNIPHKYQGPKKNKGLLDLLQESEDSNLGSFGTAKEKSFMEVFSEKQEGCQSRASRFGRHRRNDEAAYSGTVATMIVPIFFVLLLLAYIVPLLLA